MNSYFALAGHYDELTQDVDYSAFADYYEALFEKFGVHAATVLDLACGTGTLTRIMASRGYEMIGVDGSPEMLSVASEKSRMGNYRIMPMFLNQNMEELDLYGTVDATICSLDGINYVAPDALAEVLHRVWLFTEPGGIFIFDINTPEKLLSLDGEMFVDESDDVFCVWRSEIDRDLNACCYGMDIFSRENGHWNRSFEEHIEYIYDRTKIEAELKRAGFIEISCFGRFSMAEPVAGEQRMFFIARKPK